MSEKLGSAVLELTTDDSKFKSGMDQAESRAERLAGRFDAIGKRSRDVGKKLSLAVTAPIGAMAITSVNAAREQAKAVASVDAALASMGNRAGFTSAELQKMASSLQQNSLFGDEKILKDTTATLLRFGNITGETFSRAQQAALDMAQATGKDLASASLALGRALDDPVESANALTRAGVKLTEQQQDQIKAMAEAGDVAGAQALLLSELEKKFDGAAAAANAADGGVAQLSMAFGDFQEQIGATVLELVGPFVSGLQGVVSWLQEMDPATRQWVVGIGLAAAAAGPLLIGFGLMASAIGSLIAIAPAVAAAFGVIKVAMMGLFANPILLGAAAVIAGIVLAWQNWDKIQPIIDAVAEAVMGWWNDNVAPVLEAVMQKVGAVADFFRDYFGAQIKAVVAMVSALMRGDFAGAWAAAQQLVRNAIGAVITILQTLAPNATAAVKAMYEGVKTWLQDKLGAVFEWVRGKIREVEQAFGWLYDRVVGNSWIPDLVRDVGAEMAKLGELMVKPAIAAADAVDAAFAGIESPVITPQFAPGLQLPGGGTGPMIDDQAGQQLGDRVGRFFSDGIRAALDGDLGGFLKGWLGRLGDSLIDSLGQSLANALGGISGGGGGGLGGILGSVFAGFFAKGGTIPTGQFGIVGENGPEFAFARPGGLGILSNPQSRALMESGQGGMQFSIPISIDATGADPAAIARVRSELERLRAELPGRIITTVQDADQRRILGRKGR